MRIIDRYICREVLLHGLLGLAVFTFIFFVPQLVRMMDLLVRHSGSPIEIAELILCTVPGVLTFTVPIAVLLGVQIGIGRMSADSELTAMNALCMGVRRLLLPVVALALAAVALSLAMTVWLGPAAQRTMHRLRDQLTASQASFEVQPRVFNEQFPHLVLYVQDISAAATHWHGVFLAESDAQDLSRLTLAEDAIVIAERTEGKLELYLHNGSVHEVSADDPNHYGLSSFVERDFGVSAAANADATPEALTDDQRSLRELAAETGPAARHAYVEINRRLAFPAACLVFALLALPLAARPRRGGRAAGFVIALLVVSGYYIVSALGEGLARNGALPPWLGMWSANLVMAATALVLLPRAERMPGEDRLAAGLHALSEWAHHHIWRRRNSSVPAARPSPESRAQNGGSSSNGEAKSSALPKKSVWIGSRIRRGAGFPQLLDVFLLRNFMFYFILLMVGFLVLSDVFTLFEILDDVVRHDTGLVIVFNYFRYFSCYLFYQLAPLACLVAVLVTLGVMAKNNELVALKAAGVSIYRVAFPLIALGFLCSVGLIALDSTYLPYANQRQDALRNQIAGRPAQTYYQPERQWILGDQSKVYNYRLFDPDNRLFGGLSVFELDPKTFAVRRRVYAERAHWEPQQKQWILESGWVRDFQNGRVSRYTPFPVLELAELDEPPDYFHREVRQSFQMSWWELQRYIEGLRSAGFDVARLSVQLQRKLAFPLI